MRDVPEKFPRPVTRGGLTAEEVFSLLMHDDNAQMVMEEDGSIYFRSIDAEEPGGCYG